jgi:hypothetical protein
MQQTLTFKILVIAMGLFCASLSAQESALPTQTDAHGTSYLSGGIGDGELEMINQASKAFNLKLLFAEKSGAYAADVPVTIVDRKGSTVLEVPSAGPILLATLPDGSYRVSASYEGRKMEKRVNVRKGKQAALSFYW